MQEFIQCHSLLGFSNPLYHHSQEAAYSCQTDKNNLRAGPLHLRLWFKHLISSGSCPLQQYVLWLYFASMACTNKSCHRRLNFIINALYSLLEFKQNVIKIIYNKWILDNRSLQTSYINTIKPSKIPLKKLRNTWYSHTPLAALNLYMIHTYSVPKVFSPL